VRLAHIPKYRLSDADVPSIYFDPVGNEGILISGSAASMARRSGSSQGDSTELLAIFAA
jgi:hypothetical protein